MLAIVIATNDAVSIFSDDTPALAAWVSPLS